MRFNELVIKLKSVIKIVLAYIFTLRELESIHAWGFNFVPTEACV